MYGFFEKWLLDLINVDYEPFVLNDGTEAATVSRRNFDRILIALKCVSVRDGDQYSLRWPYVVNSDVHGMKVVIHRYWMEENILHNLTGADAKQIDQYHAFIDIGPHRFDAASFKNKFVEYYHHPRSDRFSPTPDHDEIPEDQREQAAEALMDDPEEVEEEVVQEEVHIPTPEEDFLSYINDKFSHRTVRLDITPNGKKMIVIDGNNAFNNKALIATADSLDKNIIVLTDDFISISNSLKKKISPSEVLEHSIFLCVNPGQNNYFYRAYSGQENSHICFGNEIRQLYCVKGNKDTVKENIRNDSSLTSAEKDERLVKIDEKPELSSYSKYDAIFKDTATNIVWAVRDRCFIHFMFSQTTSNKEAFETCLKELSRRFDRRISLKEMEGIDKKYQSEISEKNKGEYVKFSISNTKTVIDEIKALFKTNANEYKTHLDKAMEFGKLANKYRDQIEAFDEKGFALKEEKKALSAYQETLNIPEVLSINVSNGTVNVYTQNIYAQDERSKRWHDIGTFHITIGMLNNSYNQNNTVRIINTKHQVEGIETGMQAPHVFSDGHICHGSLATGMVEAYKRRDMFQLVYQLILFLQDANTNDTAGAYINKWPEVSESIATNKNYLDEEEIKDDEVDEVDAKFDDMLADALADAIPTYIEN